MTCGFVFHGHFSCFVQLTTIKRPVSKQTLQMHHLCFLLTSRQQCFLLFAAEITMFDSYIVVYKFVQDLHFFVTAGSDENELILAAVLQGFFDAVGLLLRYRLPPLVCSSFVFLCSKLFEFCSGMMSRSELPLRTWT